MTESSKPKYYIRQKAFSLFIKSQFLAYLKALLINCSIFTAANKAKYRHFLNNSDIKSFYKNIKLEIARFRNNKHYIIFLYKLYNKQLF